MRAMLLPLLVAALPAVADVTLEDLEAKRGDWETYRFPQLLGDSAAIARINTFLQVRELQILPGRFDRSPFERIWPKAGEHTGVNSLDYRLNGQGPGFVSLEVEGEYTSAYSSMNRSSYNFDLHSGRPLGLADLFSSEGLLRLQEQVRAEREQRLRVFLAALPPKPELDADELSDDQQWQEAQRFMYARCLEQREDFSLEFERVQLGNQLTLVGESCANHASRALDELGEFTSRFSYAQLDGDLSPYGRCLLLERRDDCEQPLAASGQGVYRGTLGQYPITLVLEQLYADGSLSASYFYDKHARYIELGGEHQQDVLTLHENGEPPARFELEWQADGGLHGQWQQGEKPPLDVRLQP